MNDSGREPLLDMFIFETLQLVNQLEELVLNSEKSNSFTPVDINEIFRIMHTIKGSAGMMQINTINSIAHAMEDLFSLLRETESLNMDYSIICDLVLNGIDFIKEEISKVEANQVADGLTDVLLDDINNYLASLNLSLTSPGKANHLAMTDDDPKEKHGFNDVSNCDLAANHFRAVIMFEEGCEMENIRAFNVSHKLKEVAEIIQHIPYDIESDECIADIREQGFIIDFSTDCSRDDIESFFLNIAFVESMEVLDLEKNPQEPPDSNLPETADPITGVAPQVLVNLDANPGKSRKQKLINVQLSKLDQLLDLVGELVISEAMVTSNPDLVQIQDLENFNKAARQHRKVIDEMQDVVMSIRMVPLAGTFQKMNRLVRDMSKQLDKQTELEIQGEDTEVDKNIIEHLSDPLMHIIRNSIDHGIEYEQQRINLGKPPQGKITLEAKNEGGEVWITVKDDGVGLEKDKILSRALEHGLIDKAEAELSDQEIYSFIMLPGFSTNTQVTEFSGRGVGMDVVAQQIDEIGGSVHVDSTKNEGTTVTMKIPLTLAIIAGMGIRVGNSLYTVPMRSIRESFKIQESKAFTDPNGQEMIMVRGDCYPILRLYELFEIQTPVKELSDGIIMMVETDNRCLCLFADELMGEQQVVFKALPKYLKKIKGISGCTLLGDGRASLIIDVAGLINY